MKIDFLLTQVQKGSGLFHLNTIIKEDKGEVILREKFEFEPKNIESNLQAFIKNNYGHLFFNEDGLELRIADRCVHKGNKKRLQVIAEDLYNNFPHLKKGKGTPPEIKRGIRIQKIDSEYLINLKETMNQNKVGATLSQVLSVKHKKRGLVYSTFKDGKMLSSKSVLRNGGLESDNSSYANYITELFDSSVKRVLLEKESNGSQFFRAELVKNTLTKLGINVINGVSTHKIKKMSNILADDAISKYIEKLEEELAKPEHNIVYVDGSKKKSLSASGYILSNQGEVKTKTLLFGDHHNYEELSVLMALHDILIDEKINKNKTHFVCDYDRIEAVKNKLDNPTQNTLLSKELINSPLFKKVKELYEKKENKIYFHFLKSHTNLDSLSKKGNDLIDKILKDTINENSNIDHKDLVDKYDLDALSGQFFNNKGIDMVKKGLTGFKKNVIAKKDELLDYNHKDENFRANVKLFVRYKENNKTFTLDVENKHKFLTPKEKKRDVLSGIDALKMLKGRSLQIIGTKDAITALNNAVNQTDLKYIAQADDCRVLLLNTDSEANKMVNERREYANKGKLKDIYGKRHQKQMSKQQKVETLKQNEYNNKKEQMINLINDNLTEKEEKRFNINFENAYGNESIFPASHTMPEDKNIIILKHGDKSMNIHKFENGKHSMSRYDQDESPVIHLDAFLNENSFSDNTKPLVLSMPNSNGLRELGGLIRGEKHNECNNVKGLLSGKKKDGIFIAKTIDFMFTMIENNVKWYTDNLIDIPIVKEKAKRKTSQKPS